MILAEVGLELEMFLLDKDGNILEPLPYGFPSDEMGFLIEIRTHHSNTGRSVLESLSKNIEWNNTKAEKLGFKTSLVPRMLINADLADYFETKYNHLMLPDHTKNLYGNTKSHHTGLMDGFATAGMHVHFSAREILCSPNFVKILSLPYTSVIEKMDNKFSDIIAKYGRIRGEYEMKSHGFEYRSLPNNAPADQVVENALKFLNDGLVP